jgi:hypothetical protein
LELSTGKNWQSSLPMLRTSTTGKLWRTGEWLLVFPNVGTKQDPACLNTRVLP